MKRIPYFSYRIISQQLISVFNFEWIIVSLRILVESHFKIFEECHEVLLVLDRIQLLFNDFLSFCTDLLLRNLRLVFVKGSFPSYYASSMS